jgi:Holliday junction resolvase RusA-like endonuclease
MALSGQEVIEIYDDSSSETHSVEPKNPQAIYDFYIPGRPTTLPRPRFFRNGIFNKAKVATKEFKAKMKETSHHLNNGVLFDINVPLTLIIIFYIPRPQSDFVGLRRAPGNLKPGVASHRFLPIAADIDNLVKFVLDALNGLVYKDDRQVVKLVSYKLRDNSAHCAGATRIIASQFKSQDFESHLDSA